MTLYYHPTRSNIIGNLQGQQVYNWDGPLRLDSNRSWIMVLEKVIWHLTEDKMAKLQGLHHSVYTTMHMQVLTSSVPQHNWACISAAITTYILPYINPNLPPISFSITPLINPSIKTPLQLNAWQPPELAEGGPFYKHWVRSLNQSITTHHPTSIHSNMLTQGLELLDLDRCNYSSTGSKKLVILWREWPSQHW